MVHVLHCSVLHCLRLRPLKRDSLQTHCLRHDTSFALEPAIVAGWRAAMRGLCRQQANARSASTRTSQRVQARRAQTVADAPATDAPPSGASSLRRLAKLAEKASVSEPSTSAPGASSAPKSPAAASAAKAGGAATAAAAPAKSAQDTKRDAQKVWDRLPHVFLSTEAAARRSVHTASHSAASNVPMHCMSKTDVTHASCRCTLCTAQIPSHVAALAALLGCKYWLLRYCAARFCRRGTH